MDEDGYETCGNVIELSKKDPTYSELMDFLLESFEGSLLNVKLIIGFTNSARNREILAHTLLPIFRAAGKAHGFALLHLLIDMELDNVNESFEVFRNNSVASTAFVNYAKTTSTFKNLQTSMNECIEQMHDDISGLDDQTRNDRNAADELTKKYIRIFLSSSMNVFKDKTDQDFVRLCYIVSKSVEEKFKADKCSLSGLCSFIFLRLINPSMLDQCKLFIDEHKLEKENKSQLWKPLIYVAKIVQTIANRAAHRVFDVDSNEKWHSDKYVQFEEVMGEETEKVVQFIDSFVYRSSNVYEFDASEDKKVNKDSVRACEKDFQLLLETIQEKVEEYQEVHGLNQGYGCIPFILTMLGLR